MDIQVGKRVTVDDATLECIGYMLETKNCMNKFIRFESKEKAMTNMLYMMKNYGHPHKEPYPIFRLVDVLGDSDVA